MNERNSIVTMKGKPLTLLGNALNFGDKAPDFEVVTKDLSTVKFSSFADKICILTSLPSLDTSICDIMTRRFNEEAVNLGKDVTVITISMDLPFAQARWCAAADVKNVYIFSDYQKASFGQAYGVLIKDLRLLARAVFIVDREGIIRYQQIVPELSHEPDYDQVIEEVQKVYDVKAAR